MRAVGDADRPDGGLAGPLTLVLAERVRADIQPRPANADRVVALNLGRETADDAAAFDLELGPNNCAVTAPE